MGAVTCDVQYSGVARALVACASLATMALLMLGPFTPGWQVAGLPWAGFVACRALRRLEEVRAVRLDEHGTIDVRLGSTWHGGRLVAGSVVLPWLVVIRWRPAGGWMDHAVFLLPSMLDAESFRALRLTLRWARPRDSGAGE